MRYTFTFVMKDVCYNHFLDFYFFYFLHCAAMPFFFFMIVQSPSVVLLFVSLALSASGSSPFSSIVLFYLSHSSYLFNRKEIVRRMRTNPRSKG